MHLLRPLVDILGDSILILKGLDAAADVTTLHTYLENNAAVFINLTTATLLCVIKQR